MGTWIFESINAMDRQANTSMMIALKRIIRAPVAPAGVYNSFYDGDGFPV